MGKKRKSKKTSQEKQPLNQGSQTGEKPAGRKKKRRQPAPQRRDNPNWPLTALAAAGMLLTAYLALIFLLGGKPLYCNEGSTCDIVQQSRWGTFMGMPISLLGFLTYATLAFIGFKVRNPEWHWKAAWTVSLVGLGYSLYLNTISLFVIEAMCPYCLASLSIMAVIFFVVISQKPVGLSNLNFKALAGQTLLLTILIIGGMHLHYGGVFDPAAGPEDPYLRGLAEHLSKEKAVIYGAFW